MSINYLILETSVRDVHPVSRLLYDRLKTADWRRRRLAPRFRQPAEVSCNCHLLRATSLVVSRINLPYVIYSSRVALNGYSNNGKCCLTHRPSIYSRLLKPFASAYELINPSSIDLIVFRNRRTIYGATN